MSCLLCHKPFFSSAVWLHHSWPLPRGQPHLSDINHCVLSVVNMKATRNLITKLGPYALPCPRWAWTKNLPICLQCFDSPGYFSSFYVNWFSLKYGLWLVSLKGKHTENTDRCYHHDWWKIYILLGCYYKII